MNGKKGETLLKDNVAVVLVDTIYPGNIGSVARAMKNMGVHDLFLVNSTYHLERESRIMAVNAVDILEQAKVYSSLEEAVAEYQLVIGSTRRMGKIRQPVILPMEMTETISKLLRNNKVCLVFGPEDRGLSNHNLNLCNHIIFIPTDDKFGSLNLSHAVIIVLYELRTKVISRHVVHNNKFQLASSKSLENMYQHFQETLLRIGFLDPQNPQRIMTAIRGFFTRVELTERHVKILRGILRQLEWYCQNKQ